MTWYLFAEFESDVWCVGHLKATSLHHPTAGFEPQLHARGPRIDASACRSMQSTAAGWGPRPIFAQKSGDWRLVLPIDKSLKAFSNDRYQSVLGSREVATSAASMPGLSSTIYQVLKFKCVRRCRRCFITENVWTWCNTYLNRKVGIEFRRQLLLRWDGQRSKLCRAGRLHGPACTCSVSTLLRHRLSSHLNFRVFGFGPVRTAWLEINFGPK
jgi:hypothetical protein